MNDRNCSGDVEIAWQSLVAAMLTSTSVRPVSTILSTRNTIDVPSSAGVYAFWWVGSKTRLMQGNRHIVLKGPGGTPVDVSYHDWWPNDAPYPCLYVGKATNLRRRFGQHLLRKTEGRAHHAKAGNEKATPKTTSCQLRFGIEHVFPDEPAPLLLIQDAVGFYFYDEFSENAIAERFFAEDRLVGHLRPWFNIDSER